MQPRVFVAGLAQETNAFGPLPTTLADFNGRFHVPGRLCDTVPPFPEALLDCARLLHERGSIRLIEGPMAGAHPGGIVCDSAFEQLRDAILNALAQCMPLDIVALHLHGAMAAQNYHDCEGDLLAGVRKIAGPDARIGALLDPHANLTADMVSTSDILVAYKEYPHTDFRERSAELMNLLLAAQAGAIDPASAVWDCGVIGVFHTHRPPIREFVDRMQALEQQGAALSISLIHGFPWADTPDMGTRVLAIYDGDRVHASAVARSLAEDAAALAQKFAVETVSLERALETVPVHSGEGPVVLADCPDNPGGGAAGDSTFVLRAMIERGVVDACLGPLWDPHSVDEAFDSEPGARLALRIGGKAGAFSGSPLEAEAEIVHLANDGWQTFSGARFSLGRCAAIRVCGIEILLSSERDQARGTDLFTNQGIVLDGKKVIVVKSSQHFYDSFSRLTDRILYLDCPGSLQSDLSKIPYRNVRRPRWPIEPVGAEPFRII